MAAGERREYRGAAAETTLNGAINAADTTINLVDATNWPDGSVGPFFIAVDRGLASEEKIKCISRTGNSITVVTSPSSGRGADSTVATTHVSGAAVEHVVTADDLDKLNAHINDLNDNHPSLLNPTRHDTTNRHALGTVIAAGTPGSSAVGDSPAQGVASSVARSDHIHGREGFSSTPPPDVQIGGASATGSSSSPARSDHSHVMQSVAPQSVGVSLATGTSVTNVAHADHVHNAPQHTRVLGRTSTSATGTTPPNAGTGPWLMQAGYSTVTLSSGVATVTFPSAWTNGCIAVVPANSNDTFVIVESVTTTTFQVKIVAANGSGDIVNATGNVSFGWIALGW